MTSEGKKNPLPQAQWGTFEGPLDLLLEEVRRQRVAVEEVAMAPLAARFLAYLRAAAERNIDLDIEWLQMAATLIHWKSMCLLPPDPHAVPLDPVRDGLVQQLVAHGKAVSAELARLHEREGTRFSHPGMVPGASPEPENRLETGYLSVWDMAGQARNLAEWAGKRRGEAIAWREPLGVERDDVTVAGMSDYLRARMAGVDTLDGVTVLDEVPVPRRACLFLGMLEMVRSGELHMEQTEGFGPIWLRVGAKPTVGN